MIRKATYAVCLILAVVPLISGAAGNNPKQKVMTGIEVLRQQRFRPLQGKRVGLVTNPSGIDSHLKSTVDILYAAPGVTLVALFGPEHGVRGNAHAGDAVGNDVDRRTGVKVYSLYGTTRKPAPEMLRGIDVLVYDIQDIGCRSYTFCSTLGVCMEACAEQGIEFMVLDRPNPLGGEKMEGTPVREGFVSFVSRWPVPYIYGLTPGELATFLNEEGLTSKKARLTVIPMKGWRRRMTFSDTGLPWVLPSPQIPTPETAMFYPLSGILGELYIFNTGIGYTLPFQLFCATWADADSVADAMNALDLPGLRFRPINVKPFFVTAVDVNRDKGEVHGVQTYITDYSKASLTLTQFYFMQVIHQLYPEVEIFGQNTKRYSMFDKVCGSDIIRLNFTRRYMVSDMEEEWNVGVAAFQKKARKYFMYKK